MDSINSTRFRQPAFGMRQIITPAAEKVIQAAKCKPEYCILTDMLDISSRKNKEDGIFRICTVEEFENAIGLDNKARSLDDIPTEEPVVVVSLEKKDKGIISTVLHLLDVQAGTIRNILQELEERPKRDVSW